MRIIHESDCGRYRIVEIYDEYADLENLKGDCFNPDVHTDIPREKLEEEERHFESLASREGVFGYALERWDPAPDAGWTHVDSCFGFVGSYTPGDPTFDHYIVAELLAQIPVKEEEAI